MDSILNEFSNGLNKKNNQNNSIENKNLFQFKNSLETDAIKNQEYFKKITIKQTNKSTENNKIQKKLNNLVYINILTLVIRIILIKRKKFNAEVLIVQL